MRQFYSESEAEQILAHALRRNTEHGLSREALLAVAAESGISPEEVSRAEAELAEREEHDRAVREAQIGFYWHLGPYVLVSILLVVLNVVGGGHAWAIYPILGWGIGVLSHGLALKADPASINCRSPRATP